MALPVGIDIGTSGLRAVAYSELLSVKWEIERSFRPTISDASRAEMDPEVVHEALRSVLEEAVRREGGNIVLTLSTVMHSLLALDEHDKPLGNAMLWADTRSVRECTDLAKQYGEPFFYERTACPLHSSYWPGKILWLKKHADFKRIRRLASLKAYLLLQLTGSLITDHSVASSSGVFNIHSKTFDPDILQALGVTEEMLPRPVPCEETVEVRVGSRSVPLIIGATDGVYANLGSGALSADDAVITLGSSSAVRFTSKSPVLDPHRRSWCYILDAEHYVYGEASNSGGLTVGWLGELLGFDDVQAMVDSLVPETGSLPNDVLVVPTFMSERAPDYQETIPGRIDGLHAGQTREHVVNGLVEGVAFFNRMLFDDLLRLRCPISGSENPPGRLFVTGGLGSSPRIRALLSRVIMPVSRRPEHERLTALGAAMFGRHVHSNESYANLTALLPEAELFVQRENQELDDYLEKKYNRFLDAYRAIVT